MTKNKKIYKYTKCSKCGAEKEENRDYYCSACRSSYNKSYDDIREGYFLYMVMNNDTIEYIGKTNRIDKRFSEHKRCRVSSTKHIFEFGKWTEVKYIDLTEVVSDDIELRVLENELINLYKPCCNEVSNTSYLLKNERLFQLMTIVHSEVWRTYKKNCKKK